MSNLLNPKWIFIVNTLPILLLMALFWGHFEVIKSQLFPDSILLWREMGIVLALLAFLNAGYAARCLIKKMPISIWYAVLAFFTFIPFIWFFNANYNQLIPSSIPVWMIPEETFLYAGTFLMPTLAYSMFILVEYCTPNAVEHAAWKNFIAAIAIPVLWYIFMETILPLWKQWEEGFYFHAVLIVAIGGTLLFLFLLLRGVYIMSMKKSGVWSKYAWVWKGILAILLPVAGLAVNEGKYWGGSNGSAAHVFGDFSHIGYSILAVVNGVLLCLPNPGSPQLRLWLFAARGITVAYTFYFFLVFLPFLPLSIPTILFFGAGFLILTPLLLFLLHIRTLSDDFQALVHYFPKKILISCLFLGGIVLPASITMSYLQDKKTLNSTLDYLYKPNYSKTYQPLDTLPLVNTLLVLEKHKNRNAFFIGNSQTPYLSSWYNWLVLDNLMLSDSKINHIEQVFLGKSVSGNFTADNLASPYINLSKITSESHFDPQQNAWRSQIDLEISNQSENNFGEYATIFKLPVGCWISDYYLYVGDRKEPGILSEKKAAMWIFSQIKNVRRDPGILYYENGNRVAFHVFPFAKNEIRKTGIELIHREPTKLTIDGHTIALGDEKTPRATENVSFENPNIAYISTQEKAMLPTVQRQPEIHFIVDVSTGKSEKIASYIRRIETFIEKNKLKPEALQIAFTGPYTHLEKFGPAWKEHLKQQPFSGGFYAERAIKTILVRSFETPKASYPCIVMVTDEMNNAIIEKDFSDFKITFPESDFFYELSENDTLTAHSLSNNPHKALEKTDFLPQGQMVRAWPNAEHPVAWLPNNNQPDMVLKSLLFAPLESDIIEKKWLSGFFMHGQWLSQVLHPEQGDVAWLTLVKNSFRSKIMTPVTSYLVVENDAQKAMLKQKQEQVLSGNKAFDAGEDTQRMSEPDLLLLILLLLCLWRAFKKNI